MGIAQPMSPGCRQHHRAVPKVLALVFELQMVVSLMGAAENARLHLICGLVARLLEGGAGGVFIGA